MAIMRFEPLSMLQQMQNEMSRLLEHGLTSSNRDSSLGATSQWVPSVDIKEEKDKYLVLADLPGVKPENIDVSMEHNILTLKGSRANETKEEKDNYVRIERMSGTFYRQFTLPDTADTDKIQAKFNNGVLEISIPKREIAKNKKVQVSIEG